MPTMSNRAPTARQGEWLEHVQTCRARGLSLKAYAEQAGLDVQRLYQWHRRLKLRGFIADAEAVHFAAVRIGDSRSLEGAQRLHFPNGLVLEWEGSVDLALVEHLLRLSPMVR